VIQFLAGLIHSAALEANHSSQKNVNAELYVCSFYLQNTLSSAMYGKGSTPSNSQNLSFLLQESVLSAAGTLTALFLTFTYFT
jgi:hypothetical protein